MVGSKLKGTWWKNKYFGKDGWVMKNMICPGADGTVGDLQGLAPFEIPFTRKLVDYTSSLWSRLGGIIIDGSKPIVKVTYPYRGLG